MTDERQPINPLSREEQIAQKVVRESKLYSNYGSLSSEDQKKLTEAITSMVKIFLSIKPEATDAELLTGASDTVFSLVAAKKDYLSRDPSKN